ncbi:MAG: tetratricopeptide repeat protein [bacterium]|nr:tetratricopeptide repeat protein [bacterium]MDD5354847.1 tetratricopeptide repeat protein [bacterium]MDD5756760.1 tetratricopeptide repeat protein [bacterium]
MAKTFSRITITVFLMIFLCPLALRAETSRFALGLGYPYFLVRYDPVEIKYATGDGINVFAGRLYLNFYKGSRIKAFTGIEGGYIKFNTLDIRGTGYEGAVFIGGEYFITEHITLAMDLSPTYIGLKSTDNDKVDGYELVANAAIYYYFAPVMASNGAKKGMIDADTLSKSNKQDLIEKYSAQATQYNEAGEYDKAISAWQRVLEIDSDNTTAKEEIEKTKFMIATEDE